MLLIEYFIIIPFILAFISSFFVDFVIFCLGGFESYDDFYSECECDELTEECEEKYKGTIDQISKSRIFSGIGYEIKKLHNDEQLKINLAEVNYSLNIFKIFFICPYCTLFWIVNLCFLGFWIMTDLNLSLTHLFISQLMAYKIQQYI